MSNEEDLVVDLTSRLVEINSVINVHNRVFPSRDASKLVAEVGKDYGFEVYELGPLRVPQEWGGNDYVYPIVLVKRANNVSNNQPVVLYLGHLDVVPVTDEEIKDWDGIDPFSGKIEGDRIYGRGSFDMKGADAAFISAFALHGVEKGTVVIALSGDEEVGGFVSMPAIISFLKKKELMPDYVINGEPSTVPVIVTKRRASTKIVVRFPLIPKKVTGHYREFEYESFQGDGNGTLHSALYVLGADSHGLLTAAKLTVGQKISYLYSSSKKWNSVPKKVKLGLIDEFPEEGEDVKEHEYFEGLSRILEGFVSLPSIDWGVAKSTYGISIAPNIVDLDRERNIGEIIIDVRAMLKDSSMHDLLLEKIRNHFKEFLPDVDVSLAAKVNSMFSPVDSKVALALKRNAENEGIHVLRIGEKLGGASDSRYFSELGIPSAELGPSGRSAHGPKEWVSISSLKKLVRVYRNTFEELVTS